MANRLCGELKSFVDCMSRFLSTGIGPNLKFEPLFDRHRITCHATIMAAAVAAKLNLKGEVAGERGVGVLQSMLKLLLAIVGRC